MKRSKKMQVLNAGDQHKQHQHQHQHHQYQQPNYHYHHYQSPSRSPANSSSCSPPSTPSSRSQQHASALYTQDATYSTLAPDRQLLLKDERLQRYLAATCNKQSSNSGPPPPPRPWLSPAQQLQYLSKGKLKQLFQVGRINRDQFECLVEARSRKFARQQNKQTLSLTRGLPRSYRTDDSDNDPETGHADDNTLARRQLTPAARSMNNEFTILSYNVLSDRIATRKQFPSSPDLALDWLYRSELILRQLRDHDADIVALQELEMEQYESFFKPKLGELGHYSSLFESKSRARTMDLHMRKRVDGCAIFYKRDKFKLVGRHLLEFNQIAMANARGSEAMLNRVMTKDNIGLVAVLELIARSDESENVGQQQSGGERSPIPKLIDQTTATSTAMTTKKRLIICNTHIYWDPECCDVKLIQTIMLMNELRHIARFYSGVQPALSEHHKQQQQQQQQSGDDDDLKAKPLVPLVLLGDFNSLQKSGVVQYILDGNIDSSHKDFKEFKYTQCSNALTLLRDSQFGQQNQQREPNGGDQLQLVNRRASHQQQASLSSVGGQTAIDERLVDGMRSSQSSSPTGSRLLKGSLARRQSSPITCGSTSAPTPPLAAASSSSQPTTIAAVAPVAPPRLTTSNHNDKTDNRTEQGELLVYGHPFKLASAYENGVMPFTNYCTLFKATIDYIFYDNDQLELLGSLGPLDKNWLKESKLEGFPQMGFPSDHLLLMAKFKLLALADDENDDDGEVDEGCSSISQLSSVATSSSASMANKPNDTGHGQSPVADDLQRASLAAIMRKPTKQARNLQNKQHLYINSNQQHHNERQHESSCLPARSVPPSPISTSANEPSRQDCSWYRLKQEPPPVVVEEADKRQDSRPVHKRGNLENHYHHYIPHQNVRQHHRQVHQQHQQQQAMQMKREQLCKNDDSQQPATMAAAISQRTVKQRRQQLHKRLTKQMRPDKAWLDEVPLLVKLKEDWS